MINSHKDRFNYKIYQNQQKNGYATMSYKDKVDKKARHITMGFFIILILGGWLFVHYNANQNNLSDTDQISQWYAEYVGSPSDNFDSNEVGKFGGK